METKRDHYRNVFKSDHLGVADLEDFIEQGKPLIFTISHTVQEIGVKVAGKKGNHNIAYFKEPIKPLVVNAGNGEIIRSFVNSPIVQDWNNVVVELYIGENVKSATGGTTRGVRIRQIQPVLKKEKPLFGEINFAPAKKNNATREQIESKYTLTEEVYTKYLAYELPTT
ncbi:hypothetical protein D3C86_1031700 [compost metagenome]